MQNIKSKISGFGAFLAFAGLLSSVLSLFNYELRILMWIDLWGTGLGWLIRLGVIVGGALIFFLFQTKEDKEAAKQAYEAERAAEKAAAEFDWPGYRSTVRADSRFTEFMSRVDKDYDVSFDAPDNGDTFHIKHYAFFDAMGKAVPPDSAEIASVSIYAQRDKAPKNILIGSQFENGTMKEPQSMELSGSQWRYMIPAAALS